MPTINVEIPEDILEESGRKRYAGLAKSFLIAYISQTSGVSYATAKKEVGDGEVGELWLLVAAVAERTFVTHYAAYLREAKNGSTPAMRESR